MTARPPTLDPVAADRLARRAPAPSPWLHEEVGRRMAERLEWIRLQPEDWVDWRPVQGGLEAHALVSARYPKAPCTVVEPDPAQAKFAAARLQPPWWRRWSRAPVSVLPQAPAGQARMLWANMALHAAAEPQALIARWHQALAVDGFLMFSSLGPDSLRELRQLYADLGWPPAGPDFTDMHDWGDMLVEAGFAEPVMDMERITLTWTSPEALLAELRTLGTNLHPARFPACRGRAWRERLLGALRERLTGEDGRLALGIEIVYGHALRPLARPRVAAESAFSLQDMRQLLRGQ